MTPEHVAALRAGYFPDPWSAGVILGLCDALEAAWAKASENNRAADSWMNESGRNLAGWRECEASLDRVRALLADSVEFHSGQGVTVTTVRAALEGEAP